MDSGKQQQTNRADGTLRSEAEQRQRAQLADAIDRFKRRAQPGRFVKPLPPVHDNGAAGSGAESPENILRISKRKTTERLTDELSRVKAELERTRLEKDELSRILAARDHSENSDGTEFCEARSSTMREEQNTANETLMVTMNKMSLSGLNILECVPAAGETELNKRVYDHWKNVLNASMNGCDPLGV